MIFNKMWEESLKGFPKNLKKVVHKFPKEVPKDFQMKLPKKFPGKLSKDLGISNENTSQSIA